ncbi:iron dependent repressor, metal binding and dimerization domain protein [Lutispora thermophila]|nr:iron dependent repressor, metal binding and dimerization domain protein [Lutispora thermophila]
MTPCGLEHAKLTSNKHQIIRKFLIEVLKVDEEIADKDACSRTYN